MMFGILRSKRARAVEAVADFFARLFQRHGKVPVGTLRDPYCLGFLQSVGVHVASQSLDKGSGTEAKAVFEEALQQFAPSHAEEAAELLLFLLADEFYLRGKRDGDLYMGWMLLQLAPERDGEAALERFFDRVRQLDSAPNPRSVQPPPRKAKPAAPPSRPAPMPPVARNGVGGSVGRHDWVVEDKTPGFDHPAKEELSRNYDFFGLRPPETTATLRIVCTLEASLVNDGETVILDRRLRFYLRPFRLLHEAEFIMRLSPSDGTSGGEFDVIVGPVVGDNDTALIAKYGDRNDVANCVAAIMSGKDLVFMLRDEKESLVNFVLPNDGEFKRLYDETYERLKKREVVNETQRYKALHQDKGRNNTQPSAPSPPAETKAKPPVVNAGKWQLAGSGQEFTLHRTYSWSAPSSAETTAALKIICTIRSSPEANWVFSDLHFNFKPFRIAHERSIVLGLFTDEPKGALVEVKALPVPEDSRDALLDVVMLAHRDDVTKLLRALSSGKGLTFALMNPAPPDEKPFLKDAPELLARFALPNDPEFKELYDEACEQVANWQDATRERQLEEGWYRRRTPGRDA
jgi:hypothetical protein